MYLVYTFDPTTDFIFSTINNTLAVNQNTRGGV